MAVVNAKEELIVSLTGNDAVAEAMRQINPDVVAAYPITPQTELMHKFAEYVADGLVKTEFVLVESEHSAMSACIGASAAGARAMTATSACGLALMWEVLYVAAGMRLPIVMTDVNRALSAPINIHCDHSDTMGARDSGWIQLYAENAQEAYDNVIQAIRIAEHPKVRLPVMVCMDGFIISHTNERLELLPDDVVTNFVGEYKPEHYLLDVDHPVTFGPLDLQDYYFEHRRQQAEAMRNAGPIILDIGKEFEKISGRSYGYFEAYRMDDAELVIICLGSTAGTTKVVVDQLREKGKKVGLLKPRVFRPFPYQELINVLKNVKAVAVLDRSDSFNGFSGPLFSELRGALYGSEANPKIVDYIYGLGGRDIGLEEIERVYTDLDTIVKTGKIEQLVTYLGVRE
ncbi:MAG: pyruvate ferredoxin oxidoreductase [bacterium]|nr:pyruvate ferredoxin oxidoreductase [bacterium]